MVKNNHIVRFTIMFLIVSPMLYQAVFADGEDEEERREDIRIISISVRNYFINGFDFDVTVKNVGNVAASRPVVSLFVSGPMIFSQQAQPPSFSTRVLAPNETQDFCFRWTGTVSSGSYRITGNAARDSEANFSLTVTPTNPPQSIPPNQGSACSPATASSSTASTTAAVVTNSTAAVGSTAVTGGQPRLRVLQITLEPQAPVISGVVVFTGKITNVGTATFSGPINLVIYGPLSMATGQFYPYWKQLTGPSVTILPTEVIDDYRWYWVSAPPIPGNYGFKSIDYQSTVTLSSGRPAGAAGGGAATGGGGGCLIATAAYGTELSSEVTNLREIRNKMYETELGSNFMKSINDFYYSFSPTIADWERENQVFREVVKIAITPLMISFTILDHNNIESEIGLVGYVISVVFLNIGMYFGAPALIIFRFKSTIS